MTRRRCASGRYVLVLRNLFLLNLVHGAFRMKAGTILSKLRFDVLVQMENVFGIVLILDPY